MGYYSSILNVYIQGNHIKHYGNFAHISGHANISAYILLKTGDRQNANAVMLVNGTEK
jgi:hypothetical protein